MKQKLLNQLKTSRKLYLISPPRVSGEFLSQLEEVLELGADIIGAFQLRLKEASAAEVVAVGVKIKELLAGRGIAFILNDSAELARRVGADGVHLGAADPSLEEARGLLGSGSIIGSSAYASLESARAGVAGGADYICFGAFFETTTKRATSQASVGLLREWRAESAGTRASAGADILVGAIGGITAERSVGLLESGADFVAVSSAVWQSGEIKQFVKTI